MSDIYLIKYSGVVGTYMTTQQAYLGYGLATSALLNDPPAIAFSSKAECLFFIQSHIYYTDFKSNGMIPCSIPDSTVYTYEMYEPKEVDINE